MRRRSFEKVNLKIVAMVALLIFFLMISVGYSMLRQKLNIYGRSTIVINENNNNIKKITGYNKIVNETDSDKEAKVKAMTGSSCSSVTKYYQRES